MRRTNTTKELYFSLRNLELIHPSHFADENELKTWLSGHTKELQAGDGLYSTKEEEDEFVQRRRGERAVSSGSLQSRSPIHVARC